MPPIQGQLPWGAGAQQQFAGLSGPPEQAMANLGANYANAYKSALDMNQANYANILKGYQDTMAGQTTAQGAIQSGYTDLYNNVLGGLRGIDASQRQDIADRYVANVGNARQSMISRGLGNSTVQDSVMRGLAYDRSKADINLSNQTANLVAGYQSNLGQAGLGYADRANMQNTALAQSQLGWMNSVNAGYPDAGMYGALTQQYGAAMQGQQDRDAQAAARANLAASGQATGGPPVTRGGSWNPIGNAPMPGSMGPAGLGGTPVGAPTWGGVLGAPTGSMPGYGMGYAAEPGVSAGNYKGDLNEYDNYGGNNGESKTGGSGMDGYYKGSGGYEDLYALEQYGY